MKPRVAMLTGTGLLAGALALGGVLSTARPPSLNIVPGAVLRLLGQFGHHGPTPLPAGYRRLSWMAMMPADWIAHFRELNYGQMTDGDTRIPALLRDVATRWDDAPTLPALNGARVRLPGYVVPLEAVRGEIREFLLVPYLGACIHVPPPPANQIVHVVAAEPVRDLHAMDLVSITGTLRVTRRQSAMAVSGYAMDSAQVEPYVMPASARRAAQ